MAPTSTGLHLAGDPVHAAYGRLRKAQRAKPFPSLEERRDWLDRLDALVVKRQEDIVRAVDADFGGRNRYETLMVEVMTTLETIRYAKKALREWMRPKRMSPSLYFQPSRVVVEYLPKGVAAVISPWNYPVNLALGPVTAALAAGNRVLLKPSELTPRTAALMGEAVAETFTSEELVVVEGGPDVAKAVTQLPVDHILFTGSTRVGTQVATAAAANLVPATLELGGKSPALIHPDYPMAKAAERIAIGKLFNAGQTCIAPDYVLVAKGQEGAFTEAFRATVGRSYPDLTGPGYTAMASQKGFDRMRALLDDAQAKGARLETIAPNGAPKPETKRQAPVLVFDATDGMKVMQEEIFGPILPVKTYERIEDAVQFINDQPRPLAFYYFDSSESRAQDLLKTVISGGACLNDTLVHFVQEEMPFGGVGPSGMGAYHGEAGFQAFSHARTVMMSSALAPARHIMSPPYGQILERALAVIINGLRGRRSGR